MTQRFCSRIAAVTAHLVLPLISATEFNVPLTASIPNLGSPCLFHSHFLADVGDGRQGRICDGDKVPTRTGTLGGERERRYFRDVETGGGNYARMGGG